MSSGSYTRIFESPDQEFLQMGGEHLCIEQRQAVPVAGVQADRYSGSSSQIGAATAAALVRITDSLSNVGSVKICHLSRVLPQALQLL